MENNIIDVVARTPETIVTEIKATEEYTKQTVILGAASIGKKLQELKELLPHGEFGKYIEENLNYSQRKAQQFMQIADAYGDGDSPYFKAISNAHTCADLSISNALRLLALPETEVESFVNENDPAALTVKELEEKIRAALEEKQAAEAERDKLKKRYDQSVEAQKEKLKQIEELNEQLQKMQESGQGGDAEDSDLLKQAEEERERLNGEKAELERQLTDLKEQADQIRKTAETEKQQAIEAAAEQAKAEAVEEARKVAEAELELLRKEAEDALAAAELAEKKLAQSSNEDLVMFKAHINSIQSMMDIILLDIDNVQAVDPEQADKMRRAADKVLEVMRGRVANAEAQK